MLHDNEQLLKRLRDSILISALKGQDDFQVRIDFQEITWGQRPILFAKSIKGVRFGFISRLPPNNVTRAPFMQ